MRRTGTSGLQRGVNPFLQLLFSAVMIAVTAVAIAYGRHYLGSSWWQTALYAAAGVAVGALLGVTANLNPYPALAVLALAIAALAAI